MGLASSLAGSCAGQTQTTAWQPAEAPLPPPHPRMHLRTPGRAPNQEWTMGRVRGEMPLGTLALRSGLVEGGSRVVFGLCNLHCKEERDRSWCRGRCGQGLSVLPGIGR